MVCEASELHHCTDAEAMQLMRSNALLLVPRALYLLVTSSNQLANDVECAALRVLCSEVAGYEQQPHSCLVA